MTTDGSPARSVALKSRPLTSGMRSVEKYSGSTIVQLALKKGWPFGGVTPGTESPSPNMLRITPDCGTASASVAACTPGHSRTRSRSVRAKAGPVVPV
jgi:hypothetical protein